MSFEVSGGELEKRKHYYKTTVVLDGKKIENEYYNTLSDGVAPGSESFNRIVKDLIYKLEDLKSDKSYHQEDVNRYLEALRFISLESSKFHKIFSRYVGAYKELKESPKTKESEYKRDSRVLKILKGDISGIVKQHKTELSIDKKNLKTKVKDYKGDVKQYRAEISEIAGELKTLKTELENKEMELRRQRVHQHTMGIGDTPTAEKVKERIEELKKKISKRESSIKSKKRQIYARGDLDFSSRWEQIQVDAESIKSKIIDPEYGKSAAEKTSNVFKSLHITKEQEQGYSA